jgi:hypothetical protein
MYAIDVRPRKNSRPCRSSTIVKIGGPRREDGTVHRIASMTLVSNPKRTSAALPHSRSPWRLPAGAEGADGDSIPATAIAGSMHKVEIKDGGSQ